jgi:hypothetical protein
MKNPDFDLLVALMLLSLSVAGNGQPKPTVCQRFENGVLVTIAELGKEFGEHPPEIPIVKDIRPPHTIVTSGWQFTG